LPPGRGRHAAGSPHRYQWLTTSKAVIATANKARRVSCVNCPAAFLGVRELATAFSSSKLPSTGPNGRRT
jgi:hypothetical protein